jgi:hypothetical protein
VLCDCCIVIFDYPSITSVECPEFMPSRRNASDGCHCLEGWVCEEYPDQPWPHDGCAGPGTQCANPTCPLVAWSDSVSVEYRRLG